MPFLREFHYTRRDFERARLLIRERAGIVLTESKHDLVYSRLARLVRAHSLTSFGDYLNFVEHSPDEYESFINALTTNVTSFFREPIHFAIVRDHLLELRRPKNFRIWSAATSTGEEAYSLAMIVTDAYGEVPSGVRILATDIDTHVLARAESAVYPADHIQSIPSHLRQRYLLKGTGANTGWVTIRSALRNIVEFKRMNLLGNNWRRSKQFDVIFCRNVMIYFDKKTQRELIRRFYPCLRPGGLLVTGHSESLFNASDIYEPIGHSVYRKQLGTDRVA